ncbi:stage III sporulation protein AF [Clostridium luticellarii]|jgi:stage III sporulation protein AF|uniref:Stage III sporulation protein AF n=1 Tax=Clostridium luticellarii TaxID=1691940 RepID=A0A2T0BRP8_9CLOT|nr:stage III sporulation protein AF [Clostridium luticellarii]MCI1943748.1 stage III sporulation protein AF [Clostridium luticellarii]MCI1967009.1 stage III sporulation protein AF [Clostridium luticellarii]PRR86546.1 Stage III sporulation protein AF [Clostridium luticellarii]
MIQSLREWLTGICTAVFFIIAVEMILPENSMKKYCKFVLGLILITVFINPIIKVFNRDFNITSYTEKAMESFERDFGTKKSSSEFDEYKKKNISDTIDTFETNLKTSCEKNLEEKYPGEKYEVKVGAEYDEENNTVCIKNIDVRVQDGTVEKVKKVEIGNDTAAVDNVKPENSEKASKIKTYLSQELNVSEDIIHVNS